MHNLRQDDARGNDDIDDWMLHDSTEVEGEGGPWQEHDPWGYADGCYQYADDYYRWHEQWVNSVLTVDDEHEVVYCEPWLHAGKV